MKSRRVSRLNSLLREVLSDVIRRDLKNPHLTNLLTVTDVEITPDMQHAKVFVSVIGNEAKKRETMDILIHAKGYIAIMASKKVELRYFPQLQFVLDEGVEKQMRIDALLKDISDQQKKSQGSEDELSAQELNLDEDLSLQELERKEELSEDEQEDSEDDLEDELPVEEDNDEDR